MAQKDTIENRFKLILDGNVSESKYFFFETDPRKKQKLAIIFGGFEKCAPDFEIRRKSYPYYVLEIPMKGRCLLGIESRQYQLEQGCIGAFAAGVSHHYKCDRNNPLEHIFITFTGSEASRLFEQSGLGKGKVVKLFKSAEIFYLVKAILERGFEKTAFSHELCCSYLRTLLLEQAISLSLTDKTESISTSTYRRCQRYIDDNFSKIFFPSEVADQCQINIRYMSRLFKKHANMTPHEYIMRLKLNKAANLLLTTSFSIKQIAEMVGFVDPYHFSRNFKKNHGLSPQNYRNKLL